MRAAVLNQSSFKFEIKQVDAPLISSSGVQIRLKASSLNHHELWSLEEKNLHSDNPIILGSDGAGIISQIGKNVRHLKEGDEVIINPSINWGSDKRVQGKDYEILGFPTQGTFAEYIAIDQKCVFKKPPHLSFQEAAAFPLAGLTAYRALFNRGEFEAPNCVLITGIGGGAALMALHFAVASGTEVYVTSGDQSKIDRAIELGAKGGVIYKNSNWDKELLSMINGFDVIIDSAAGKGFAKLVEVANPGARIVLFGRTAGQIAGLDPKKIFWKQISIHGTTMGSDVDFKNMVKFISVKKAKPTIDTILPLEDINNGFNRMKEGKQFGKIIINHNNEI